MKKLGIAIIVILIIALLVCGGLLIWRNVSKDVTPAPPGSTTPGIDNPDADNPGGNITDTEHPLSHDGIALGSTINATEDDYRIDVDAEEFDVKIIAIDSHVFEFKHGDGVATFPYFSTDWNEHFNLVKSNGYFTFDNANRSLPVLMSSLYENETIEAISTVDNAASYFGIVVTIDQREYVVGLVGWDATSITLSMEEVIF